MFTGTFNGNDYLGSTKEIEAYYSAVHARKAFNPFHTDIAGGMKRARHVSGVMLDRLYHWGIPNEAGQRKQRIYREGQWWTAMSANDWWQDVRLTESQVKKARQLLENPWHEERGLYKGFSRGPLIEARIWKFAKPGGRPAPTTHYRILWDNYHSALRKVSGIFAGIIEQADQEALAKESDLEDSDNQETRESDLANSDNRQDAGTMETLQDAVSMETPQDAVSLTLRSTLDSKTLESDDGKSDSSSWANGQISKVIAEITQKKPANQQVLDVSEAFKAEGWITPKMIALWAKHLWPDERPPNAKHPAPWPGQLKDGVIRDRAKLQELVDYGY